MLLFLSNKLNVKTFYTLKYTLIKIFFQKLNINLALIQVLIIL
jgi:hypothetical protein